MRRHIQAATLPLWTMVKLKILSMNVRGLNANLKRVKCLELMHRVDVDVVLIQESHLSQDNISKRQNKHFKVISSSSGDSSCKGVIILFKRSLPLKIERIGNDKAGRLAYVCTSIFGSKVAFVCVYAPSIYDKNFYPNLTTFFTAKLWRHFLNYQVVPC